MGMIKAVTILLCGGGWNGKDRATFITLLSDRFFLKKNMHLQTQIEIKPKTRGCNWQDIVFDVSSSGYPESLLKMNQVLARLKMLFILTVRVVLI